MGALKQDPAQVKADATKVLGINTHTTHTTKVLENIQRGEPLSPVPGERARCVCWEGVPQEDHLTRTRGRGRLGHGQERG